VAGRLIPSAPKQGTRKGLEAESQEANATPLAGPHAKKSLTDPDATLGAGALPDPDAESVDPGTG